MCWLGLPKIPVQLKDPCDLCEGKKTLAQDWKTDLCPKEFRYYKNVKIWSICKHDQNDVNTKTGNAAKALRGYDWT